MVRMILGIVLGAALGGTIGYLGKCSTGTCPFTSTWWGGAVFGGILGLFLSNMFAGAPATPDDLDNVIDINGRDHFQRELAGAGDSHVLVDFYLTSCPPCRKLLPEVYQLARENADSLVVLKVNATKNKELAREYKVQAVPVLVHIREGQKIDQKTGFMPKDKLKAWIFGTETSSSPDVTVSGG